MIPIGRAFTTTGIALNLRGTNVPTSGDDLRLQDEADKTSFRFDPVESATYTRILNVGGTAGFGTDDCFINQYTGTTRTMKVTDEGITTLGGNYLAIEGTRTPNAPSVTNGIRLYLDTSGGKTRLMALFESGAAQVVATEP